MAGGTYPNTVGTQAEADSVDAQQGTYGAQPTSADLFRSMSANPSASPYRSASPMQYMYGDSTMQNPFRSAATTQLPQSNVGAQLAQQYAAYSTGYKNDLAAADAAVRATAQAQQDAYLRDVAARQAQAAESARLAAAQEEANKLAQQQFDYDQQQSYSSNDNGGGWYSGNSGGDVGIAGLRRRK